MIFRHPSPLLILAILLIAPLSAMGQNLNMSIDPEGVYQSGCYTITIPGGAGMTLDVQYFFNDSGPHPIYGWPNLNSSGQAYVCTDPDAPPGDYNFYAIRETGTEAWSYPNEHVWIWQRPHSFSFSSNFGHAGNDSYTVTVGHGANMSLDLEYGYNGSPGQFTMPLDGNGQWNHSLDHYAGPGVYTFTAMKSSYSSEWIPLNPYVEYTVYPPRPTWSSVDTSSVQAGPGSYTLRIGNTANVTLDSIYWFNGQHDVFGFPDMVEEYPGSPDGKRFYEIPICFPPGDYGWLAVRHSQDPNPYWWKEMPEPGGGLWVTVTPPGPPSVSSVSPGTGVRLPGTNHLGVTIGGSNLCGVSLQTTRQGLTFDSVPDGDGSAISTMFHIAPSTTLGAAPITLHASGGSTGFSFTITGGSPPPGPAAPTLTREYIYLGDRVIAVDSP